MDRNGIEFTILSLNAPAVQAILDTKKGIDVSKRANDRIAEAVAKHPNRFGRRKLVRQDTLERCRPAADRPHQPSNYSS
jgi:hypothetical protein